MSEEFIPPIDVEFERLTKLRVIIKRLIEMKIFSEEEGENIFKMGFDNQGDTVKVLILLLEAVLKQ